MRLSPSGTTSRSATPWAFAESQPVQLVAHLDLAAGAYIAVAKAAIVRATPRPRCEVRVAAGAGTDVSYADVQGTVAMTVVHRFDKPGRVELRCSQAKGGTVQVEWSKITAIAVSLPLKNTYVAEG